VPTSEQPMFIRALGYRRTIAPGALSYLSVLWRHVCRPGYQSISHPSTLPVQHKQQGKGERRGDSLDYYWLPAIDPSWGSPRTSTPDRSGDKMWGVTCLANSTTEVFSPGVVILTIMRKHQQQGTILIMPSRKERTVSFRKKSRMRARMACPIAFHCLF